MRWMLVVAALSLAPGSTVDAKPSFPLTLDSQVDLYGVPVQLDFTLYGGGVFFAGTTGTTGSWTFDRTTKTLELDDPASALFVTAGRVPGSYCFSGSANVAGVLLPWQGCLVP